MLTSGKVAHRRELAASVASVTDIDHPGAPAWARRVTDDYGNDLRGPVDLLAAMLKLYPSGETRRKYRINISQFFLWLERYHPQTHILSVQVPHIDLYREYLTSRHWDGHPGACLPECEELPYGETSKATKLSAISSYYGYCVEQNRRDSNPVMRQRGRRKNGDESQHRLKPILLPHEIAEVMQEARKAVTGRSVIKTPTLRTAVVVGAFVGPGLRCEELENARAEGLGWRGKTRTLRFQRKGGGWQTIDLPYKFAPLLDAYLGDRRSGPLIISDGRRRRNPGTGELEHSGVGSDTLRDIVTEIGVITGIREQLYPHLLRHTSITLALTDQHATPQRVMVYYGHERMDTTMRYYNHTRLLGPGHLRNMYGIDWETQGMVTAG